MPEGEIACKWKKICCFVKLHGSPNLFYSAQIRPLHHLNFFLIGKVCYVNGEPEAPKEKVELTKSTFSSFFARRWYRPASFKFNQRKPARLKNRMESFQTLSGSKQVSEIFSDKVNSQPKVSALRLLKPALRKIFSMR